MVSGASTLCEEIREKLASMATNSQKAKRVTRRVGEIALLAVFVCVLLVAFGILYIADDIEGWVVDAETGKPLEGVIIVAHWQLEGGFEGGVPVGELKILETVTDENGRYYFPAWGPRLALTGRLESESPELLLFKPGYESLGLSDEFYRGGNAPRSDWDGKTIRLNRFEDSIQQYAEHLWHLSDSLWIAGYRSGDPCGWERFPRMLRALKQLEGTYESNGLKTGTAFSTLSANEELLRKKGCKPIQEVLEK